MQGCHAGVATRLSRLYPLAQPVHCQGHRMNLVVLATVKIREVENAVGFIDEYYKFYQYSARRMETLQAARATAGGDQARAGQQKMWGRIRWVQRQQSLHVICIGFPVLIRCLWSFDSAEFNTDTSSQAMALATALTQTGTMFAIWATRWVLLPLKRLTTEIQAEDLDVFDAFNRVQTALSTLKGYRANVDAEHHRLWEEVEAVRDELDLGPGLKPRYSKHQMNRSNYDVDTAEEHYKLAVTTRLLDNIILSLTDRFSESLPFMSVFWLMPSKAGTPASVDTLLQRLRPALDFYKDDVAEVCIGGVYTDVEVRAELDQWTIACAGATQPCTKVSQALRRARDLGLPCIERLLVLLLTIPVTTCGCERSMSALRRLKTYLRSTMGDARLSSLATLHVHTDIDVPLDELVDRFLAARDRRI